MLSESSVAMRELIQKVMAEEANAKRLVEAANAEAETILREAGQRAEMIVATARRQAATQARMKVEAAVEAAEKEKQELLARAVADIRGQVQMDPVTLERTVNAVVCCVARQRASDRERPV
jgi:vacuolar-type H+-ATPase subunit H